MMLDDITQEQKRSLEKLLYDWFKVYYYPHGNGYYTFGTFKPDQHDYNFMLRIQEDNRYLVDYMKISSRKDPKLKRTPADIEDFRVKSAAVLLGLPIEDMPMYLNSFITPVRELVIWRLENNI